MCGIAGILSFGNKHHLPYRNIQMMTDAMKCRGPDDEGFAFFTANSEKANIFGGKDTPEEVLSSQNPFQPKKLLGIEVPDDTILAMGHRRLSILDLSAAGHQPMFTEDGRYCIVHNGEIYNYSDIRKELINRGESFFSNTDTEVVLKAYRSWGADCLQQFNGMWAFAIWDNHKKTLFCSRDRIGIKPLYFHLTGNFLVFASDIKTIIASKIYYAEPDFEGLYHAMSFYCAPRPTTCFKGIRALEQGHWIVADSSGNIRKQRYYHLPIGQIDYALEEDEWKSKLEGKLIEAVDRRLIADVPIGAFMSGGIDSTTITAIAARKHNGIKAFTLAFEGNDGDYNELPQAQATAKMWPMEHVYEIIDPEIILKHLTELVKCHEEPYYSLSPNFLVARLVSNYKVPVVLSGLGGDELFCGYSREKFLNLWKHFKRFSPLTNYSANFHHKLFKLNELLHLKNIVEVYIWTFSIFSEAEKKKLFILEKAKNWSSFEIFMELYGMEQLNFHDPVEAICYMDTINYIGNHHLYRLDQFAMNFSIEARFPLLDHEFVELSLMTPSELKIRGKMPKYIFRKVAQKYIHPSCLSMRKRGFSIPLDTWIKGPLKNLVEAKLQNLISRGLFNPNVINKYLQMFNANKIGPDKLWQLVFIELWFEQFFEGTLCQ